MTDIQLLAAIKANGGSIGYANLLNNPPKKVKFSPSDDHQRLEYLLAQGLIEGAPKAYGLLTLTPAGLAYLDSYQHLQTERRQQNRNDWAIAIFSTLGGALLSDPLWKGIHWVFQQLITLFTK